MTYAIEPGDKVYLIASCGRVGVWDIHFGREFWLAQTFTLSAQHSLLRCRLRLWTWEPPQTWHFSIRNTNPDGTPGSLEYYHTTLPSPEKGETTPGKWRIFQITPILTLPPGLYAMVISAPGAAATNECGARTPHLTLQYPEGKGWSSPDSGLNWYELIDSDLCFEVWGWEPPPLPPVHLAVSHWAILNLTYTHTATGLQLIVTTNTPCHLFMRWTLTEPLKHPQTKIVRGIPLPDATRFCFVTFEENEQLEVGDTLTHTFDKPDWPVCQTRYFYFVATKQGESSPSASAIFTLHNKGFKEIKIYLNGPGDATAIPYEWPPGSIHWWVVSLPVSEGAYFVCHNAGTGWQGDLYTIDTSPLADITTIESITLLAIPVSNYPYKKFTFALKMPGYPAWKSPEYGIPDYGTMDPPLDPVIFTLNLTKNPITNAPWTLSNLLTLQYGPNLYQDGILGAAGMYYMDITVSVPL